MGSLERRLVRIAGSQQANAAVLLQDALASASDEEIALAIDAHRRGEGDESKLRFESIGVSEALFEIAMGPNWADEPPAKVHRRFREIYRDVLSEPRRSRIRAELRRLREEGG